MRREKSYGFYVGYFEVFPKEKLLDRKIWW